MRYSQPFGTPTPPLGSYPRYINGNPVTGTEGSIPPATAFDEAQIEIITVIQNAGFTPDHNDLTQLWQAIQSLIAQKFITTPIVKKVHGPGADFNDLFSAFNWLSQYTITNTGYVTFMVSPGRWVYTATVELNHQNLNRVAIQGGALLGGSPTPSNLSVTGYHAAADGTNQVLYLRSVYATELSFTGGVTGFASLQGGCTLHYLLITGSQTIGAPAGPYPAGDGCFVIAPLFIDGIAVWGFGNNGIEVLQSWVLCTSSLSVTCAFCGSSGLELQGGLFGAAGQTAFTNLVSNGVGLNNFGSFSWFGRLYCAGHGPPLGNAAIQCEQGGLIAANPGSQLQINDAGMIIAGDATVLFQSSLINNNASYGVSAYGNATVFVNSCTFSGNGQWDVIANGGAYIDATSAAMATNWSPAFNTYDTNFGAFILH